jgi:hypothetical protein
MKSASVNVQVIGRVSSLKMSPSSLTFFKWFRELYFATLETMGCKQAQIRQVELSLGPVRYDTVTDRSVQGSMRIVRQDFDSWLMRVPNVLDLDPLVVSCDLNHRLARVYGKVLWPEQVMKELVAG